MLFTDIQSVDHLTFVKTCTTREKLSRQPSLDYQYKTPSITCQSTRLQAKVTGWGLFKNTLLLPLLPFQIYFERSYQSRNPKG